MAGISTSLKLQDNMAPVLLDITRSMNMVINSARQVKSATGEMFDTASLNSAQEYLNKSIINLQGVGEKTIANAENQKKHNNELKNANDTASKLKSTIKGILATYVGIKSVRAFVETADDMALIQARLANIKDETMSLQEVQQAVYESAQRSRGEYMMTADVVSKLGAQAKQAFGNTNELIQFSEQLNKIFTISGTDPEGVRSVMYNLTQAMATGVLRGQDLNAVMTNTPRILEEVAKYLDTDISQIRKLAEEGKISADVIKNALLQSAEEINEEFGKMPMTVHQAGILIKNYFIKAMEPAYAKLTELVNSDKFQVFVENAMQYASMFANAIVVVMDGLISIANWASDNWDSIEAGILSLISVYTIWTVVTQIQILKQKELNLAMLANPWTWVLIGLSVALYYLYKWIISLGGAQVAWSMFVNALKVEGTEWMLFFKRTIAGTLNGLDTMQLGFSRVWTNIRNETAKWKSGMLLLVQDTVNGAIDRINGLIKAVNKIPLVSIETIGKVEFGVNSAIETEKANKERDNALKMQELENNTNKAKREQQIRAYETQAKENERKRLKEIDRLKTENANKNKFEVPALGDFGANMENLAKIPDDVAGTKEATKKIKDKLDKGINFKNEDLTYLRELATSRAINKFSFDKIEVKAENNFGDVNNMGDLIGLTDTLTNGLTDAIFETAEGLGGA